MLLLHRFLLMMFLLIVGNIIVLAQTTIFNIPSTDVVDSKTFYIEADYISHYDKYEKGGFQSFGYRALYGIGKKTEAGFNVFYTRNGGKAPIEFQPNFKWKAYENETHRISVSTGTQLFVPLNKVAGTRTYGMVYANASKKIEKARGLRLTGGVYQMIGAEKDFGTKTGAIVGFEQPIKGKFSFLADWYSGKNRLGYSAAGVNYSINEKQFFMVGYNWGNSGRGNNAFSAFYGITY